MAFWFVCDGTGESFGVLDEGRGGELVPRSDAGIPSRVASDGGLCGSQPSGAQGNRDRLQESAGRWTAGTLGHEGPAAAAQGQARAMALT